MNWVILYGENLHHTSKKYIVKAAEAYADNCGAAISVAISPPNLGAKKLSEVYALIPEGAHKVVFVSEHVLLNPQAPNIFELVPEGKQMATANLQDFGNDNLQFGLVYMDVKSLGNRLFSKGGGYPFSFSSLPDDEMHQLGWEWLLTPAIAKATGLRRQCANGIDLSAIHLNGEKRIEFIRTMFESFDNPTSKMRYNIYLEIPGALGDCVSFEPVVRHLVTDVFAWQNIVVKTNFPEVYEHLKDFVHFIDSKGIKDDGYFEINLMPPHDSDPVPQVSLNTMHPVDYAAINAFCGTLPLGKRTIKLPKGRECAYPYDVVLHPGISWPSKTFPRDWWQALANELVSLEIPFAVIGKDIDGGKWGAHKLDLGNYGTCLINKTSFKELCMVINASQILVTNDSAPLHIAGAYDNDVLLISTAKYPEHVAPYRHGSQWYKLHAFQGLAGVIEREIKPNLPNTIRFDTATPEEIENCLPRVDAVVERIKRIRRSAQA